MSASGVRHFFVLEASEYVERLDGLVSSAASEPPDSEALLRVARALRGASTMARLEALAELGAAVESVARSLRDGSRDWNETVRNGLLEAVGDLRQLIRNARSWSRDDDFLAERRTSALKSLVPADASHPSRGGADGSESRREESPADALAASGGTLHLVGGTAELAAALAASAGRPDEESLLADARRRAGALRGVAAVGDHAPLGELLDAVDAGLRGIETPLSGTAQTTLLNAARVLRRTSDELRAGRSLTTDTEWRAVLDSAAELGRPDEESVVPISRLFHEDGGPHVVDEAPDPPTTPLARFRMESAGQAEHLRRLVADAREGVVSDERTATRIEGALLALRDVALSYGETELARLIASGAEAAARADRLTLDAIDAIAARLLAEAASVEELCDRLTDLARGHQLAAMIGSGFDQVSGRPTPPRSFTPRGTTPVDIRTLLATPREAPVVQEPDPPSWMEAQPEPSGMEAESGSGMEAESGKDSAPGQQPRQAAAEPAPESSPAPVAGRRVATPTGADLHAFLADGLAGFKRLEEEPLEEPTPVEEDVVDIDSLLYDRAGALRRARELREELRRSGGAAPQETLEEIFDLLEMAASE